MAGPGLPTNYQSNTQVTAASRNTDHATLNTWGSAIPKSDLAQRKHLVVIGACKYGSGGANLWECGLDDDNFLRSDNPIAGAAEVVRFTASVEINAASGIWQVRFQIEKAATDTNFAAPTILVPFATLSLSGAAPGATKLARIAFTLNPVASLAAGDEIRVRYDFGLAATVADKVQARVTLRSELEG